MTHPSTTGPIRLTLAGGHLNLTLGTSELGDLEGWSRAGPGQRGITGPWIPLSGSSPRFRAVCGSTTVDLWLDAVGGVTGLRLEVAGPEIWEVGLRARPRIEGRVPQWACHTGYQSWDASGLAALNGNPPASWWTCAVALTGGASLALGAWGPTAVRFDITPGDLTLAATGTLPDAIPRPLGAGWTEAKIALHVAAAPSPLTALEEVTMPSASPPRPPPRGWMSWYRFGPWVDTPTVLAHSEILSSTPWRELGYTLIQVDDGWQMAYGDWSPNLKFAPDLAALAATVRPRGQTLGVWTAPFLVSASARLAEDAPAEWFIRDPVSGARAVDPRHVTLGPMLILDPANLAVVGHLTDLYRRLHQGGARYFKLDFLYAGAQGGLGSLRAALGAIREAVGDSYILACGAPMGILDGIADGVRVGPDVATPGFDFELGQPRTRTFGDEVRSVARNLAARVHLARRFQLDPDVVLAGGDLELEEGRQLATLAALSGGPFLAGDDLLSAQPPQTDLLTNPEIVSLCGGAPARPRWEPGEDNLPPSTWDRREADGSWLVAMYNWTDRPRRLSTPLEGVGPALVRDLWARAELGPVSGDLVVDLPAHGVGVFRVRPRGA